ncbi:DUF4013 domain-containing protein [Haloarchaeobius sp. HRN-SO-5]|uniref:DUF4013 domain-containing protein n=1 Tax=Haloarchaeobius sp. HRN-SO-5 TaxID=3446118 RepID=UPI003EBBEFB7
MVVDSLSFPTKGDDGLVRSIIGGALILAGTVIPIIPQLLLYGYSLQAMRAGATGDPRAPEFDDWGDLFKDGLKVFVVVFVFTLVPMVLLVGVAVFGGFALSFGTAAGGATGAESAAAAGSGLGALVFLGLMGVAGIVSLAIFYVVPAALVGVATEDDIGAAFDFGSVKQIAFTGDYLVAFVVAGIVSTVGSMLALPLMFLLVGFPLLFILQAGLAHYFGRVARDVATY